MHHVNLRRNSDWFMLSARSETLFPMLPTDWLWLFADKLHHATGQCFLAVNLKGKPTARWGRKASGLRDHLNLKIAGLPARDP
jgi:hypothetical protein